MSYQVINPFVQFVDPINGKPLSGGSVYFGRQDSDPKNQPANRINVYAVQDNGTEVLLAQPITLNGAGQPQYSGSVKQLKVELCLGDSAYAVQVFNKNGALKSYSSRVSSLVDAFALASPSSSVLVGGVTAANLARRYAETVSVKDYGAKGDGVTDDTAAMAAAHATGSLVYYPRGVYKFSRLPTAISAGGIVGDGMTETILNSTDTGALDIMTFSGLWENFNDLSSNSVFTFRDFGFNCASSAGVALKTGGACIAVTAPVVTTQRENQSTSFERVLFRYPYRGIHFIAASFWRVSGCVFNSYANSGVYVENRYDADSGDGAINDGCVFVTNPTGAGSAAVIQRSSGGLRFSDSKVLGGTYGYRLEYNTTNTEGAKATSNLHINNVSFELMQFGAISLTSNGVHPFKLIQITSSHVALTTYAVATDSSGSFEKMNISGNNFELWGGYAASGQFCIGLNAVDSVIIGDNTFNGVGGDSIAVSLLNCNNAKIGVNTYTDFIVDPIAVSGGSTFITKDVQTGTHDSSASGFAAYGAVFRGGVESVTFSTPFKVAPSLSDITLTAGDGTRSIGGIINSVSKTGFTYLPIAATAGVTTTRWEARGVL